MCTYNILSQSTLHLGKLRRKFVSVNTCNTATKLGKNLCKIIDQVAEENQLVPLMIDREIVPTSVKPCQHHQWNVCINRETKECTRYIQSILEENEISIEYGGLRIHETCSQFYIAVDKEISYMCNYPKGKLINCTCTITNLSKKQERENYLSCA